MACCSVGQYEHQSALEIKLSMSWKIWNTGKNDISERFLEMSASFSSFRK